MTLFSIVIACYNSEKFIGDCLRSTVDQDYDRKNLEVICVDDGSIDGSAAVISDYQKAYPCLTVVHTENSGLEKSCNLGIQMSKHEWVLRVDADDTLDARFLKFMDRAIENGAYDFYYCKDYLECHSTGNKIRRELPDFDVEEIFQRGDFFATGTVYRKKDLEAIGGYSESVKNCGLENYDLILRLISQGKTGCAVPGAVFHYRRHSANMSLLQKDSIIQYGRMLLGRYGRNFQTNSFHPYGLKLDQNASV